MTLQVFRSRAVLSILLGINALGAAYAQVKLPAGAPECVRWAASELEADLQARGTTSDSVRMSVLIETTEPDGGLRAGITAREQTYSIRIDGAQITVRGGGAVGAMYGLQELREELAAAPAVTQDWNALVRSIKSAEGSPFLEVRADNSFIHVYPNLLNDLPMWRTYIDMLARNRFNLLDLHGAYDLESTSFPNLYPQLVEVPGYATAGGFTPEYRAKNLASFKAIIAYARTRGVRVSFMNYSANDNKGGIYKTDPNVTNIPPAKLADYTAKAVTLLIAELPDLYMLGFRVGESMQPASFYKEAYIKGVEDAHRPDLRLYTRSWQTTQEQLEPIAQAAKNGFDIEIKFNGEHLGLPYQSMQGPAYGSYSYQGYLDIPADFQIIWQIRANGTHRFWAWEDTDFIRRTVRSCQLGAARGFTLEPHTAYFTMYAKDYYRSALDAATYTYIWQKHWMWYFAWGRLGYDPSLSESHIATQFTQHYGSAGPAAYAAMQSAGTIVPLAYAYRFVGPDQRDFSPETETGNSDTKKKRSRPDLLQYAENKPEDPRTFAGIDEYVTNKLAGKPDGRLGPFAVAAQLTTAASATRRLIADAPQTASPKQASEWRLLRTDLLAAAAFGDYHASRIQGMTHLDYALHSGSETDYHKGTSELAASRAAWKTLSETLDPVYKPLANPLRRQTAFQWSSQLASLDAMDATAPTFWRESTVKRTTAAGAGLVPSAADQGERNGYGFAGLTHQVKGDAAIVTVRGATATGGLKAITLWWKPVPSELEWRSLPMQKTSSKDWTATIPFDRHGVLYMVELVDNAGNAANLPAENKETPWRMIAPFAPATTPH